MITSMASKVSGHDPLRMCHSVDRRTHDFRHIGARSAVWHSADVNAQRILALAGVTAWIGIGLPALIQGADSRERLVAWAVAYVAFAVLFVIEMARPSFLLLAAEVIAVVIVVLALCDGFEGTLLVLIAMRLGSRLDRTRGLLWIAIQSLLLGSAIAIHWNLRAALLLAPPYLGFQILAFFTLHVMAREGTVREQLARANERLRIAQELHDAIGHHLTALTLNLEAAQLRAAGDAKRDLQKAQDLVRDLLAEVRSIVADQRQRGVSLVVSLRALVGNVPRPHVHLEIDDALRIEDPEREHILLRCAQEIVTNAARHSGAENLWLAVELRDGRVLIRARDDGHGATDADGFGLRSMRDRLERAGGELNVVNKPGDGFGIVAVLPA
jgi:signal transduction histidine kinase